MVTSNYSKAGVKRKRLGYGGGSTTNNYYNRSTYRPRSYGGGRGWRRGYRSRASRVASYYRKKYPRTVFGRQFIPRDGETFAKYGATAAAATPDQRLARAQNNYHGLGMYTGGGMYNPFKSKIGRAFRHGLTGLVGTAANDVGSAIGIGGLGALAEKGMHASGIGMYTGNGGYAVANDLVAGGNSSEKIMRFDPQSDSDHIRVSHSEYVMDLYAPEVYAGTQDTLLRINPGNQLVFPMLSQPASNFEDCEIEQLAFTYRPSLSDWQTTTGQVGSVVIATQYNPDKGKFITKEAMLAQTGSTSAKVTEGTLHGVECDPAKLPNDGKFHIRTGPVPLGDDLTDYDLGFTQVRVMDVPSTNITLGEIHVSYTVTLRRPRIWSGQALALQTSLWSKRVPFRDQNMAASQPFTELTHCMDLQGASPTVARSGHFQYIPKVFMDSMQAAQQNAVAVRFGVDPTIDLTDGLRGQLTDIGTYRIPYCVMNAQDGAPGVNVTDVGNTNHNVDLVKEMGIVGASFIEFPSQVAGSFSIDMSAFLSKVEFDRDDMGVEICMIPTGNLTPVYDMSICRIGKWSGLSEGGNDWSDFPGVGNYPYFTDKLDGALCPKSGASKSDNTNQGWARCTLHVRAHVASQGTPNRVYFFIKGKPNQGDEQFRIHTCELKIQRYNTTLNRSRDGSDDKPVLVDTYGQAVIQ